MTSANIEGVGYWVTASRSILDAETPGDARHLLLSAPWCGNERNRDESLLAPLLAAALTGAGTAPVLTVRFEAEAFFPAHVARLAANLEALAPGRINCYVDFTFSVGRNRLIALPHRPDAPTPDPEWVVEYLSIVHGHLAGTVEQHGDHLYSEGRMVGPRPTTGPTFMVDSRSGLPPDAGLVDWIAVGAGDPDSARGRGCRTMLLAELRCDDDRRWQLLDPLEPGETVADSSPENLVGEIIDTAGRCGAGAVVIRVSPEDRTGEIHRIVSRVSLASQHSQTGR